MQPSSSDLIPLAKLAGLPSAQRPGKRIHRNTLLRWITDGVGGAKLAAWKIGNSWYTTEAAWNEFVDKQQRPAPAPPTVQISDAERQRRYDAARERLARKGYYVAPKRIDQASAG